MITGVAALALALGQANVAGMVRDSADLEPVAFARVAVIAENATIREAISDRHGAFVLAGVASGPGRIEVGAMGYQTWAFEYDSPPEEVLRVLLHPAPVTLDSLVVRAQGSPGDPLSISPGSFVIDQALVRAQPVVFETDPLRAAAISPAASSASDWAAVPRVRGGEGGGTPVLLDGVRLFNPFHVFGMMSALNGQAVRQVKLLTGSEGEAQAAGSLSGAYDILTRDGARDGFKMGGSLGLLSLRLSAEGPIGPSASYLADARRSHIGWITGGRVPFSFDDIHAKVTRDLGGVGRLSVTGYLSRENAAWSRDDYYGERQAAIDTARWRWANAAGAAHYRSQLGEAALLDITAGHSEFRGAYAQIEGMDGKSRKADEYEGAMRETRVDVVASQALGRVGINAGVQAIRSGGDHEANGEYLFGAFAVRGARTRIAAHASVEAPLLWGVSGRFGLRVDRFLGLETTFAPSAGLSYEADTWKAWLSGSRSRQALSSVRNEESIAASLFALDVLLPVDRPPVPASTDIAAGWEDALGEWSLRVEAYARWLDHLRLFRLVEADVIDARPYATPASQELASGSAQGLELSWSWIRAGRGSLVGSYRWGRAKRTVQGIEYTPRFHRDHELELSTGLERGSSLWSLRFSGRSGQPMTESFVALAYHGVRWPDSRLRAIDDAALFLSGAYNEARLPSYFRIDFGWRTSREVSWFGGGVVEPYVSIANLFSLPNVVASAPMYNSGRTEVTHMPQLPMFPFFGAEFRF